MPMTERTLVVRCSFKMQSIGGYIMDNREAVINKIKDAQMVLVGVGEEFSGKSFLQENKRYLEVEAELQQNPEYIWILPYIQHICLEKCDLLIDAVNKLVEMLADKNYFVVTTCMNGILENAGFKEKRLVAPCGGFYKFQCSSHQCDSIEDVPQEVYSQIEEYFERKIALSQIRKFSCSKCNCSMEFNSLYSENYKEAGYLEMWEWYSKWLQGTLNKKLCILELGVSMDFPSVIRFPFEKIAFFNKKADFIRVHEKLYQLSEEIGDKGISYEENAVTFLNNIEIH